MAVMSISTIHSREPMALFQPSWEYFSEETGLSGLDSSMSLRFILYCCQSGTGTCLLPLFLADPGNRQGWSRGCFPVCWKETFRRGQASLPLWLRRRQPDMNHAGVKVVYRVEAYQGLTDRNASTYRCVTFRRRNCIRRFHIGFSAPNTDTPPREDPGKG